jgi:hypothetical protein
MRSLPCVEKGINTLQIQNSKIKSQKWKYLFRNTGKIRYAGGTWRATFTPLQNNEKAICV